jgi:hypothetical protein
MSKITAGQRGYEPMELVATLHASMAELSATAWKIVSHVGHLNIVHYSEQWMAANDPVRLLKRDIASITKEPIVGPEEISGGVFEVMPGLKVQYAKVSLKEFCTATGLSKSAVASSINEAIAVGVLERRRNSALHRGDLASLYRLRWDRLLESAKAKKQARKARSLGSARKGHGGV